MQVKSTKNEKMSTAWCKSMSGLKIPTGIKKIGGEKKKMNTQKKCTGIILAAIMVASVVAFTGIVSALPDGATMDINVSASTKDAGTVGTNSAQGGYITGLNATVEQSTAKWQGYCGNVTGSIVLMDGSSNKMFDWGDSITNGGTVLATTSPTSPTWAGVEAVTTTERDHATLGINYLWSWDNTGLDCADDTFSIATGSVTVAGKPITATVATDVNAILPIGQGWQTLVIDDSGAGSIASKDDYIFVGKICENKNGVFGSQADYQLIVPVSDNPGDAEMYRFYVELA
jgi:hypothetical protein